MADHAGGRRSVVNPGTKLWRPPVELLSVGTRGAVLAPVFVFVKPNKNNFISMKPNSNLNHLQQLLFHSIPPSLHQYNLFGLTKNGRQNRTRRPPT